MSRIDCTLWFLRTALIAVLILWLYDHGRRIRHLERDEEGRMYEALGREQHEDVIGSFPQDEEQ